jgi:hypothetical protein
VVFAQGIVTRRHELPKAAMAGPELPTDALPILIDGCGRLPQSLLVGGLPFLRRPGFAGSDGHAFEAVNLNVTLRDEAIRHGLDGSAHVARLVGLLPQACRELDLRPARLGAWLEPGSWRRAFLGAVLGGRLVTARKQTESEGSDASSSHPAKHSGSPSRPQRRHSRAAAPVGLPALTGCATLDSEQLGRRRLAATESTPASHKNLTGNRSGARVSSPS